MSEQQAQGADAAIDLNNELKTRREKLAALREQGVAFPNDFRRDHTSDQLHADFDGKENEELEALNVEVAVAGRMMTRRIMGKASFVTLQDVGGRVNFDIDIVFHFRVNERGAEGGMTAAAGIERALTHQTISDLLSSIACFSAFFFCISSS